MSEEQVDYNENTETETNSNENERPAGYAPVDVSTAPPEQVQERIDYLFKQIKDGQRTTTEYRRLVEDQSRKIDELTNGFGQVVDHLSNQSIESQETTLRQQMRTSFESGDMEGYEKAQSGLVKLQVQKEVQKNAPKPQKQAAPQEEETITLLNGAHEENYVDAWSNEKQNGVSIRPWAQQSHPDFQHAYHEATSVLSSPRYASWSIEQKMDEVDRRMGTQKQSGGQIVMGGNLTGRTKGTKITMTDKQREIAVKTKFGSRDGAKTDADYIAAYRKQIEQTKGRR